MLPARPAERVEHIARHVMAALHRDGLDGARHVLNGDSDEAVGDFFRRAAVTELAGERLEGLAHRIFVELLVLRWPENMREEIGQELPRHDIGVGDGERSAAPIAQRSGSGASRVEANAEARAVIVEDRAAASRDRMDRHHRRAHPRPGHHALEAPLIGAVVMADIGRRAAHVEADDLGEACCPRGLNRPHHAAGGARQDGVLAPEQCRRGQPARGLHEE